MSVFDVGEFEVGGTPMTGPAASPILSISIEARLRVRAEPALSELLERCKPYGALMQPYLLTASFLLSGLSDRDT